RLVVTTIFRAGQAHIPRTIVIGIGPAHVGALGDAVHLIADIVIVGGADQFGIRSVGAVAAHGNAIKRAGLDRPVHRFHRADAGGVLFAAGGEFLVGLGAVEFPDAGTGL